MNKLYRVNGKLYRAEPDVHASEAHPCSACAFDGFMGCANIWFSDAIDCSGTARIGIAIPVHLEIPASVEIVEVDSD